MPTINIPLRRPIPHGVYAGWVWVNNRRYAAAIFIGNAATFGESDVRVEAHLLDFFGTVTATAVTIESQKFLRPNQKFCSVSVLQQQMAKDIMNVRLCLQASSKKSLP